MTRFSSDEQQPASYGSFYWDANGTAQIIETANTPICIRNATQGGLADWTFVAGSTGAITAYADAGGGEVTVTSGTHGLVTGDIISIRGTTNYNGVFEVTKVDDNNFKITDTWVADDGASDWDSPDYLLAGAATAGDYLVSMFVSCSEQGGAGSVCNWFLWINTTQQAGVAVQRKFSNNDVGSMGAGGEVDIAVGDRVFLTVQSDGTNTVTHKYGSLTIHRI